MSSRASTNSGGSNNIFSDAIGVEAFRHSAHIRFLSRTFPFLTVMQAYTRAQEPQLFVFLGELINVAQHLAFVLNPHFGAVWGYILGGEVSEALYAFHLPFYDRLLVHSTDVTAAFYSLLSIYLTIAIAIVVAHIAIGVTAARTDRYNSGLVTFIRFALRSMSSWLWIPFVQTLIAPLACITHNGSRVVWYYAYYADASRQGGGRCEGGNHIAFIVMACLAMAIGAPLYFMARWCEYPSRGDSVRWRARRHWYVDATDFVHSAVMCVLFQTLIANGRHGVFACILAVTSAVMVALYCFFLPFYHHRMHYLYVGMHTTTAVAAVLAAVASMNDNWYATAMSPVLLLGSLPLLLIFSMLWADFRINPKFLRALQLCSVDGKLATVRLVRSRAVAREDEMIETIVPLPAPHRHIPYTSVTHRMRFPAGLQDETLAVFAPFDDFDDRVRVAIIGKQTVLRGVGGGSRRGSSTASRGGSVGGYGGTDDDDDDAFLSGAAGASYTWGTAAGRGPFSSGDSRRFADNANGGGGKRRSAAHKLYPKRFSRLLVPYITAIWCPTDVELSVSFIGKCIRRLHRNPTKSMSLLAMHTFARGIVKYPQSAFLRLQYGGFIAEHLPNFSQFGIAITNGLQQYDANLSDAFRAIQLKQSFRQALSMRSQSDAIHSRNALAQHREVLGSMQRFWGLLMEPTVSIQLVSAEADLITRNRRIATQHFRRAIQHLSVSNWPLIVNTGEFLSNVLLDEEGAAECFKEARELHEARMAGNMKGSRVMTFAMPDIETLSQRLLSLLSVRRDSLSSSVSAARGVVQHLLTFLSAAFVVLLAAGGVFLYVAIDERNSQLELLDQLAAIGGARAAAVQFTSIVYAVEGAPLADRLAVMDELEGLSETFGVGIRALASAEAFSVKNRDSLLDLPSIPWSFVPISAQYLPFDASGRTLTNSRGERTEGAFGSSQGSDGGSSLRTLMEVIQSSMQTLIYNNVSATPWEGGGSGPIPLLNDLVDNDLLLLKDGAGVVGVALTYMLDVLSRAQRDRLRTAFIILTSVFAVALLTLAFLRAVVYVSLRRSSLERVFTFQLMTLIPFDTLERLASETRDKRESIRRYQGGSFAGRRDSFEGALATVASPTPSLAGGGPASGVGGPTAASPMPHSAVASPMGGLSLDPRDPAYHHYMMSPSVGDVFGPPTSPPTANGGMGPAAPDPFSRSVLSSPNTATSEGGGGGQSTAVAPISTTIRSRTSAAGGAAAVAEKKSGGGAAQAISITVLPPKAPMMVPLKSALKSSAKAKGNASAANAGGAASGATGAGGAASSPNGPQQASPGAGQGRRGPFSATAAITGTAVQQHGTAVATVKRVTFAVPQRRARQLNGDSNLIYSALSGRRIVSATAGGRGGSGGGGGIGMVSAEDGRDDMALGYVGVAVERTRLLRDGFGAAGDGSSSSASSSSSFFRLSRNVRGYIESAGRAALVFAVVSANCLFLVGTIFAGLGLEKGLALPALEQLILEENDLFLSTNVTWIAEDTAGARFVGLGLPEDLATFLGRSNDVTNAIPMFMNLRLNDPSLADMGAVPAANFGRVTAANMFTGGGTAANAATVESGEKLADATVSEDYNAAGSLGNGPNTRDAVGLMVQVDKAHIAQTDVKKDALAIAAIGHGVSIAQFTAVDARRGDPYLMRRLYERQRTVYEHAQVVYMTSFLNSSRGEAPASHEDVTARWQAADRSRGTTVGGQQQAPAVAPPKPRRIVVDRRMSFEEFLAVTSPVGSPYDMPADFLLLLGGMAFADMAGFSVDSRRLLSSVMEGRLAAAEGRVTRQSPRAMVIASMSCFAAGIVLLLAATMCPVYEWTSTTLRRWHLLGLCLLASVPMIIAAVALGSNNLGRKFTEDQTYALNVHFDASAVALNRLYQNLYVVSGIPTFWTLYNGCRCNIYSSVIRIVLRDYGRENYVSQRGATDLFTSARVVKMLQGIANALTTTTIMNSHLDGLVPTYDADGSSGSGNTTNSSTVKALYSGEYGAFLTAVDGLAPVTSEAVRRELRRSIADAFWDKEGEVGQDDLEAYFSEEVSAAHPYCYYTNATFDLERRSPTAQRQLSIKISFGDRLAKVQTRIADVSDSATHRAMLDFRSSADASYRYTLALVIACVCSCALPIFGVAFVLTQLVGTAYSLMGLRNQQRNGGAGGSGANANRLDSSSSQAIATRTQWSLLVVAILLAVPFGIGVWVLVRDDTVFAEGVKMTSLEFERLQTMRAVRELTAPSNGVVMGLHSVDHSKSGVRMPTSDLGVFTVSLRSSIRDFLFGPIGDGAFYALGAFRKMDEELMGSRDVEAARQLSESLARDTCDNVIDPATVARVTTMSRLAAAAVEAGGASAAATTATLARLYTQHGLDVNSTVLLHSYQQWVDHLNVADLSSRAMAGYEDKKAALKGAVGALEQLDGAIRVGFRNVEGHMRDHFDYLINEGFTLFIVFTSLFIAIVIIVYVFVVIPLVRNLLEEGDNARLLLRMIPANVREKIPAIVQYVDTGKIDNAAELQKKFDASEKLLQNILPSNIATRLKAGEVPIADTHPSLTILFTDLVGFTKRSTTMPAAEIVDFLNEIFQQFDTIVELLELEKIKTIGDAYFMAGGLDPRVVDHELRVAEAGMMFLTALEEHNEMHPSRVPLQMRLGIHTGPAIAGVIGTKKVAYELWGDSVGIANAMESTGVPGFVHISQTTAEKVQKYYILQERGPLPREKEHIPDNMPNTYLVVGRRVPTPYQHIIRPKLSRHELV